MKMLRSILSLLPLTLVITSAFVTPATRNTKGKAISSREERRTASFKRNFQEEKKEERGVEDKIPKHLPLKVKLRSEKEKAFKDLNNGNWPRDFELEVTNMSDKPIYRLELVLVYPEILSDSGFEVGLPLRYGRVDFVEFDTRPIATDVPIQPRQTFTFHIPEQDQQAWREHKARRNWPDPKRVKIIFAHLSFGDGTGFTSLGGTPFPFNRKQSANAPYRE